MHICAWQSADSRVTTDHCRVTLRWVFTNFFLIAWNVEKTLFDSRPTVAWPPTNVTWPFSDFFQNFHKSLETSKKRCLTVSRRSRDLRPLSRDRSATFFKKFSNCLKRPKNVVWQSADGRVTSTTVAWPFSDFFQKFCELLETSKERCLTVGRRSRDLNHCRVTVQRLFSKFSQIAWNVLKTLFDSRRTVAWPPTTVAWPFSDFFQKNFLLLETSKNVVWQSADGRVTSDHCRVTVQRLFSKIFLIAWNVQKTSFDSQPTVAWPQPLSRDRSAIFFKNFPKSLETSKKRCLTVGRRSRDLRPLSRDRSATFFKIFSNRLKRPKNVVWQSADGRVTSDHCRVTVQRLFSKKFLIAWNVQKTLFDSRPTVAWPPTTVAWPFSDFFQNFSKLLETSKNRCLTVSRRSRDLRPLSRDRSATFFKIFPNRLKHRKIVVWRSADSRVTSDHCRVTVQRLFSKFLQIARNVQKTLFDSRPTVAWPPTTVAWPFSDFFQKFS